MEDKEHETTIGELGEIIQRITGKKALLRYARLDLIRFVHFYEEQKKAGKNITECASEYIPIWERTTATEKINNFFRFLEGEEG